MQAAGQFTNGRELRDAMTDWEAAEHTRVQDGAGCRGQEQE